MAFDGIVTRAMVHELNNDLQTGRITKIYQPTDTELVFQVRKDRANHSLLVSAHSTYARFHVTKDNYDNPKQPPMLCMLLRKHLVGGFVERIEQIENERIVNIQIRTKNEIGDETLKTLVIEIMGKHSNIMLVDQEGGHILDSIKHLPPAQNSYRTIMPGQPYKQPPSQGKTHPLKLSGNDIVRKLDFNTGKMDRQLLGIIMGFSPLLTKEIVHKAGLGDTSGYSEAYEQVRSLIEAHSYTPAIYEGDKEVFHVLPLDHLKREKTVYGSVSEMLDAFYSGKAERDRIKQQAGDLHRFLKNEIDKNHRKIKKHQQTIKKSEAAEDYQKLGELLTAHMHLVKQGDEEVTVTDYYKEDQPDLTISLNPNKSPSENAQNFFRDYQKLKNSKLYVEQEVTKAEQEIEYLERLLQQVESARSEDVEEIREELREEGYMKKRSTPRKQKNKKKKPSPEKYIASDGTELYVGRNNLQNEYVSNRLAHKEDVWLHAKDIPGSHVVVKSNDPSEDTLYEAAQLAAYYSKFQASSSVPVDYTKIKHVKKPSGAKPGFVTYDHQKTLFVTPEEKMVKQLKRNAQ
ncbi:NFACT RNA binding domain-containing protein [Salimicrobium sp. PL1-032A]|uniref:Rqc2 family fibronectin-binding protein n=1 Tax=Salimicrobium sp. PL1-032A TaxID=3095364 RepID=UPI003261461D